MSRIPDEVWLHLAKRLPVGRTARYPHKGDRTMRPNLIVGHDAGKYWCYCQSCKGGSVVEKSHVLITGVAAPATSTQLDLPRDREMLSRLDEFAQSSLAGFLAGKNMDALYLPTLWFSEERKRLLVDTGQGWFGRDTTERSDQKWLTYNGTKYLGEGPTDTVAVVVEDPFSFYKVKWALREARGYTVYCALGTAIKPGLALVLASHSRCILFMDGDKAGYSGADTGARKVRSLGGKAYSRCAPAGLDPKDMQAEAIREHLNELCTTPR